MTSIVTLTVVTENAMAVDIVTAKLGAVARALFAKGINVSLYLGEAEDVYIDADAIGGAE